MTKEEAYTVLGLQYGQHTAAVRSAYRKLSKQFHPDINPNGHDEFIRINAAYEVLTATNEQQTKRSAPQSDHQRAPQASDFPDATEEELFWLLHPHEKSRLAYTAYYNSQWYIENKNYRIIAQGLNFIGYLVFVVFLSFALYQIYGHDFIRPVVALSVILGAFLMPNFKLLKQFTWSLMLRHLPEFLLESIVFRFGFLAFNMAWMYYFLTRLLVDNLLFGALLIVLTGVLHYALFYKFLKLHFSGFISIGLACFIFNLLFSINSTFSWEKHVEEHGFSFYQEEHVRTSRRTGETYTQILTTPTLVFDEQAYTNSYLFRFRPWQRTHPSLRLRLTIHTGLLGIEYVETLKYVPSTPGEKLLLLE